MILVRHAMPQVDPSIRSERWELGDEGRAAARALRPLIPQPAYSVASPEPKAAQTVQELLGAASLAEIPTDAGFAEVHRPHVWSADADYRALARAYVEGTRHDGWEPHEEVAARFDEAVARHTAAAQSVAPSAVLVIGTHGLAPTVWLASRFDLVPSPAEFWAALRFPDLIEVDLQPSGRIGSVRQA